MTKKQSDAARENIKKAQAKRASMTTRQRALAQPEGHARKKPGAGGGEFYRIEIRPKSAFVLFRTQDVGEKGGLERIAGKRSSGSRDTATRLVSKEDAHIEDGKLIIDDKKAASLLDQLGSDIIRVKDDNFKAKPRKNVAEKDKPTAAQKKAQAANIGKAQIARTKKA